MKKFYPHPDRTQSNVTCCIGPDDDGDMSLGIGPNDPDVDPNTANAIFLNTHPLYPAWLEVFQGMREDFKDDKRRYGALTQEEEATLDNATILERRHDMGPAHLRLEVSPEQVHVSITHTAEFWRTVEFCVPFSGGGKSENTLQALRRFYNALP